MQAVTFDFYETLVHHRAGLGRGGRYRDYLASAGLACDPWEHRVLYDVFEDFDTRYSPELDASAKAAYWVEFTRGLFDRTHVQGPGPVDAADHAEAIRAIMGPSCLAPYDDALEVLGQLRRRGLRLGVISDWQRGLRHFCEELGIGPFLDVVVVSAEVGHEKPDRRLFVAARERLGLEGSEILHVGDRLADVDGAEAAGFAAVLLVRGGEPVEARVPVIRSLREVLDFV